MTPGTPVVLGLCSGTHDSSAALIAGGKLIGLVEEERLNEEKHTRAYPQQAISWLLEQAAIEPGQVTHVAYNFRPWRYLAAAPAAAPHLLNPATARRAVPRARSFARVYRNARSRLDYFQSCFPAARVTGADHHLAHGLYALAAAGAAGSVFESAAILVIDSLGETATTTISRARRASGAAGGGRIDYQRLHTISDPASLGYVYGAVTQHLGWRRSDEEGTVMALSALGDASRFRSLFLRAIPITESGFTVDPRFFPLRVLSSRWPRVSADFAAMTCPPRLPQAPVEQVHQDLAAALQERTEQVMVHLARRARTLTGARTLVAGGGVAMNCVAIGRICERAGFGRVAVPPAPGDSGTSAGAALAIYRQLTGYLASGVAGACYLGPGYPEAPVGAAPRPGLSAAQVATPARRAAEQLAAGQIVAIFRGRLEAGPRALGNRSILASPLDYAVVDRLNSTVKFREPFRPFAPVVLAEHAARYFTLDQASPFMAIASGVTAEARAAIPAIVHVNGTARVQTVTRAQNPFLADVLTAFAALTGHPVLINTSLNIKGKPICGTPDMALDCMTESGLDALLLNDWWVTRNQPAPALPAIGQVMS